MSKKPHVVGVFSHVDTSIAAVRALKARGLRAKDFEVFMPTYVHELADEIDESPSPIRWVTLLGGLTGLACAIAMQGWMSLDWPIRTSMKPVLSWPAYTVIMFELTVLIGGLSNLLALFGFAKLPKLGTRHVIDPRFTDDKFGVLVPVSDATRAELTELLKAAGAEEVNDVDA